MEFEPVRTISDLKTLNQVEIVEGYWDGKSGEPEPGNNRSRSYWHGWRTGAADGGYIPHDDAMRQLAHEVTIRNTALYRNGK